MIVNIACHLDETKNCPVAGNKLFLAMILWIISEMVSHLFQEMSTFGCASSNLLRDPIGWKSRESVNLLSASAGIPIFSCLHTLVLPFLRPLTSNWDLNLVLRPPGMDWDNLTGFSVSLACTQKVVGFLSFHYCI